MRAEFSYGCLDGFRVGTLLLEAGMRELMPNGMSMPTKMPLRSRLQARKETVGTEQSPSSCQQWGELVF